MPITTHEEYGFSHSPSYSRKSPTTKTVSVNVAIEMVVRGEIDAMDVFSAMTQDGQRVLNKVVFDATGKLFKDISPDEQKKVFMMVSIAQGNSKKWWQFWR